MRGETKMRERMGEEVWRGEGVLSTIQHMRLHNGRR